MFRYIFIFTLILFLSGCVMKNDVLVSNVKDINIIVKNDALNFENELLKRFKNINKSSNNILTTTIAKNDVINSKYKKKIYVKDGMYQYKICYVNTHYFDVEVKYQNKINIIKTDTKNDSCDEYIFEDYKVFSVQKIVDKVVKFIN